MVWFLINAKITNSIIMVTDTITINELILVTEPDSLVTRTEILTSEVSITSAITTITTSTKIILLL